MDNSTTITNNHNDINQLARKAAAGTLKRIYTASGQDTIRKLQQSLQADFNRLDNAKYNTTVNVIGQTISDAYDIYLIAYEYLHEQIIINSLSPDDIIAKTLKNGNDKTRTVFQWACVEVRKYIYSNKSIENNGKYVYIEDLKQDVNDTGENALDREYIRMGKYNGIQTIHDYTQYGDIMKLFEDKPTLLKVIKMRMQGLPISNIKTDLLPQNITDENGKINSDYLIETTELPDGTTTETVYKKGIAGKLDVSHQAISKQLANAQTIISDNFPELTRVFKGERKYKNTMNDSIKFWNGLMRNSF